MTFRSFPRFFSAVLAIALFGFGGTSTTRAEGPAATVLATGHLDSVVALPLFLRLYRAYVPAGRQVAYRGSNTMLYDLKGGPEVAVEGSERAPLAEGAGVFVAADRKVTIGAAAASPADLLLFVLSARPNQKPPLDPPAVVKELFRTGDPLPGLHAGSYEFTLARLVLPADAPSSQPYYRTGVAVNYVLSGTASLIADGKTETIPAGGAQAALPGWFHQWANPGEAPLVILRASLDPEGAPSVVPEPTK